VNGWSRDRPRNTELPEPLHNRVVRAFGRVCYVCGAPYHQIDHVVPWSQGGETVMENLRPICGPCHTKKSAAERRAGFKRREAKRRRPPEPHPSAG